MTDTPAPAFELPSELLAKLDEPLPQLVVSVDRNEKADAYRLLITAAEREWLKTSIPDMVRGIKRLQGIVAEIQPPNDIGDNCTAELAIECSRLRALNTELIEALNDLLNDCINFDGGKLTEVFQIKASAVLAKAMEQL
jgi:hypothetical protein